MFNNIGSKIKALAKVICWLGVIISVITGIIGIINGTEQSTVSGIITIIFGSLASWLGSFFAYGFGQLIENTDEIRKNTSER